MCSSGLLHTDKQGLGDQLEPIYNSSVLIQGVAWKTCPRGVTVKGLDFGIIVSEFELQSRYYAHFRISNLGKGMNPHPPSYGLNSIIAALLEG